MPYKLLFIYDYSDLDEVERAWRALLLRAEVLQDSVNVLPTPDGGAHGPRGRAHTRVQHVQQDPHTTLEMLLKNTNT